MSGRTSNGGAFFQVVAGTAPKVDGDGAFGRGLPSEVDGLAGLGVQAGGGDVERVGTIGLAALSENKQGGGGNSQEGGCGETHLDVIKCCEVERQWLVSMRYDEIELETREN